mmetsp:Transcript_34007/g.74912  ORF Transcript_34007/g.74912 Transcript_34007/m.74912 type:complete len:208 (-) Transcript_34007:536-1159(-)
MLPSTFSVVKERMLATALARWYPPLAVISHVHMDSVFRLGMPFTALAMCFAPCDPSSQSSIISVSIVGMRSSARASCAAASASKLFPDRSRNLIADPAAVASTSASNIDSLSTPTVPSSESSLRFTCSRQVLKRSASFSTSPVLPLKLLSHRSSFLSLGTEARAAAMDSQPAGVERVALNRKSCSEAPQALTISARAFAPPSPAMLL